MSKKIIAVVVILLVCIIGVAVYFALNSNGTTNNTSSNNESEDTGGIGSNVLVVYFSAQNHTESVANTIASELEADVFEVTPVDVYTEEDLDYNNESSRVSQEYADESLRDVELETTDVANWDSYDTIIIGYPIWWGEEAWPIESFVKTKNFDGKQVVPFCTSESSDIGDSGTSLAELAGTGEWLEGQCFTADSTNDDVLIWIGSLL